MVYAHQLDSLAALQDDPLWHGKGLHNLGIAHYFASDYVEATAFYLEALPIWESIPDSAYIGKTYLNLGACFEKRGKDEATIQYFLKAQSYFNPKKDSLLIAMTFNNIANRLSALNKLDSAAYFYQQTINLAKALKRNNIVASAQGNFNVTTNGRLSISHNDGIGIFAESNLQNEGKISIIDNFEHHAFRVEGRLDNYGTIIINNTSNHGLFLSPSGGRIDNYGLMNFSNFAFLEYSSNSDITNASHFYNAGIISDYYGVLNSNNFLSSANDAAIIKPIQGPLSVAELNVIGQGAIAPCIFLFGLPKRIGKIFFIVVKISNYCEASFAG